MSVMFVLSELGQKKYRSMYMTWNSVTITQRVAVGLLQLFWRYWTIWCQFLWGISYTQ